MRKLLCGVLAALLFTGCASGNATDTDTSDTESITVSVTEEMSVMEEKAATSTDVTTAATKQETTVESTSETTVKITEKEVLVEIKEDGFVYKKPTKAYLSEIMDSSEEQQVYLAMYADGSIEKVGKDRIEALENRFYLKTMEKMLTEEYYEQLSEEEKSYYGVTSYEEYKAFFTEYLFGGNAEAEEYEPAVYFVFEKETQSYGSDDEEPLSHEEVSAYALRAADYLFTLPTENDAIVKNMAASLKGGNDYFCHIVADYTGNNILNCYYAFSGTYAMAEDTDGISEYVKISADGSDGFVLGNSFIPEDTEVLAISSRDETSFSWLAGDFIPEGCQTAASDEDEYSEEDTVFDIAEINEKLPNLKELYMYQAVLENADKLTEMKNLEVLAYYRVKPTSETDGYMESVNDTPFIGMDNLKELRVFGSYEDYSFLGEMKGLENAAVSLYGAGRKQLESVFECNFITELDIDGVQGVELDGIEKLSNLKILEIDGDRNLDVKSIGKLENLEELEIMSRSTSPNLSEIAKLKKLKKLMLHSMEDEDLSFIGEITSLEELDLYYVNSSFEESIGKLKNLKSLSLNEISRDYSTEFLSELDKLEQFHVFSNYVDLKGASEAKNLKNISVWLCSFYDLSELEKCKSLESLMIYNCTSSFDARWIDGLKLKNLDFNGATILSWDCLKKMDTLENLSFYFCELDDEQIGEIKEALPDCVVDVETL